jgi:hypothetical protein
MIFDAPNSVHQTAQERKQRRPSKAKCGQMPSNAARISNLPLQSQGARNLDDDGD